MNVTHGLYTTQAIRAVESQALASLPPHALMRRAAGAACELVRLRWPEHAVHILCGPGNNGGDGLMLAALLHDGGQQVLVWAMPAAARPADAGQAWFELPAGLLQEGEPDAQALPRGEPVLIVDALFGIGLSRPLPEQARRWVAWANAQDADLLALDVPSGLDADTGAAQDMAVIASHTITFIGDKPGLHTRGGADHAGAVSVADLDLAPALAAQAADPQTQAGMGRLVRAGDFPALFGARKQDTHKGSFGTLGLIAGAPGMAGAALLAARAALYLGAGKIFVGLAQEPPLSLACDPLHPELMLRPAGALLAQGPVLGVTTWVAGCGLGVDEQARAWLAQLLEQAGAQAIVLDADALTCIAGDTALAAYAAAYMAARIAPLVLTPHPLEAARLLHTDAGAVQADRIAAARELAARYGAWVVLKGAGTVVSSPDGDWSINSSGNPGLATAGTGDVLAGMLGALLAQGLPVETAVRGGVWLHGAAADELARQGIGPIGLTAGELAPAARALRNG